MTIPIYQPHEKEPVLDHGTDFALQEARRGSDIFNGALPGTQIPRASNLVLRLSQLMGLQNNCKGCTNKTSERVTGRGRREETRFAY